MADEIICANSGRSLLRTSNELIRDWNEFHSKTDELPPE